MEAEMARHVIRAAFRSARELEGLLALLKSHCNANEYNTYSRAIATAIDSIHHEIIDRVISSHAELKDDIEAKIAAYGRYL